MKLSQVLPALEQGQSIRRASWTPGLMLYIKDTMFVRPAYGNLGVMWLQSFNLAVGDVKADDWEIVEPNATHYMTGTHQFADQAGNVVSPVTKDTQDIIDKIESRNTVYGGLERL